MSPGYSITVDITLVDHNSADIDAGTDLIALTFGNVRKSDIAANLPRASSGSRAAVPGAALGTVIDPLGDGQVARSDNLEHLINWPGGEAMADRDRDQLIQPAIPF
jgi:hypothetical protein